LWDVASRRELMSLTDSHTDAVLFDRRGHGLFTLREGEVHLWPIRRDDVGSLRTDAPRQILKFGDASPGMSISNDGRWLAVPDRTKGKEAVFDLEQGNQPAAYFDQPGMDAIALSRDGRWLASGSMHEGASVKVWDRVTRKLVAELPGRRDGVAPTLAF